MRLNQKISLTLFLIAVFAAIFLGYIIYTTTKTTLEKVIASQQLQLTTQTLDKVSRFLNEKINNILLLSKISVFEKYLLQAPEVRQEENRLVNKSLREFSQLTGPWDNLVVVNNDDIIVASLNKNDIGKQSGVDKDLLGRVRSGEVQYSDTLVDDKFQKQTMVFAAPVRDSEDPKKLVLGAVIGKLSWPVVLEILQNIQDQGMVLVNKEGMRIGSNIQSTDHKTQTKNLSQNQAVQLGLMGESGSIVLRDDEVREKLVLVSYIPEKGFLSYKGNGWVLLSEIPQEKAFAVVRSNSFFFSGIMILIFLISILIISFILKKLIINPIALLTISTQDIIKGNFGKRVKIKSIDEIGILGRMFNSMASTIQELLTNLEQKVEEKTGSLEKLLVDSQKQILAHEETKKAMFNLLEDAKNLEEELKTEKVGIEKKVVARTREVRDEQARLFASIENLDEGFILTDIEGHIIVTNHGVEKIIGKTNTPWTLDLVNERLAGVYDIKSAYNTVISERNSIHVSSLLFLKSVIDISLTPIYSGNEKNILIGLLILIRDKTEEKMLQRSRDEFFSIASHELRTPLTAIRGNSSMISDMYGDKLPDGDVKEMIGDIHKSSLRLIDIVNDFLDVSRIELGKITFKNSNVNLPELLGEVFSELEPSANGKKLYLKLSDIPPDLPKIYGDKDKIKQIAINLIGNAMKFTDIGGITVEMFLENSFVHTKVIDTGKGIAYKNQVLLFRKFQQAGDDIHTRDVTKGTGLGLYISKLLAEGMGGKVELEKSIEGKGSTFAFVLPVAKSA